MVWQSFHHPDISWPVVRRRAGLEFMELLDLTALFLCKGGWGVLNRSCYPSNAAYRTASSRLQKQGLVVWRNKGGATPQLRLTETGRELMPAYFHAEKLWNRPWNKLWYLLVYDVPEVDRKYRNVLRQVLKRKRMGCLQQSVWITSEDIRPDFDDLSTVASIGAFAYLFESRTVLGLSNNRVVEDAWNFERLRGIQEHYCSIMEKNIEQLRSRNHSRDEIAELLRMSLDAYHAAMTEDPLLPRELHPKDYLGQQVQILNQTLFSEIDRQTGVLHPG
ncbi:MAG: hypothetical protein KAH99_05160 [Verrucomicrobia bacterium]|nr:hypothetical protein [Verrucomicrobiota bacterium]